MIEASPNPTVIVLAGINGAGKTTASRSVLANTLAVMTFVNADVIAQGLSGFDPDAAAIRAGQVMLEQLDNLAARRASFAFETTLAARTYAGKLHALRESGYEVRLFYFWLDSVDLAIARVAARVKKGGHHISASTIRQRYGRSLRNLFNLYMPVVTGWKVYDNSAEARIRLVAEGKQNQPHVVLRPPVLVVDRQECCPWLKKRKRTIAEMIDDDELMTEAIRQGVREELLSHARAGNPVPSSENGRIVWLSPEEIYRRLDYSADPGAKAS